MSIIDGRDCTDVEDRYRRAVKDYYEQCVWPAQGSHHEPEFYLFREEIEDILARIRPRPQPCGLRSLKVRKEIFDDPDKTMIISRGLEDSLQQTKVQLEADETFACLICVMKKPKYISEVISPAATGAGGREQSRLTYIMEPEIMVQVMEALERDTIK
jgi:hypothetical protein